MPRYRNPDSEPHIKRIDSHPKAKKQNHRFQVHFSRGDALWTKSFSDGVCGDKEAARAAARAFRKRLERIVPESKMHAASRDSATGYSFREHKNRDGSVTRYISASARDRKGHPVAKAFRIEGDDLEAAVKEALAWRASVVEQRA